MKAIAIASLLAGCTASREVFGPLPDAGGGCASVPCVLEVAAGFAHTCVRTSEGHVRCWGQNEGGQIGFDSVDEPVLVPTEIAGVSDVVDLCSGFFHVCAATGDGRVFCWGANWGGQLADGTLENRPTPVEIAGVAGATQVSCGTQHSCATTDDRGLYCWGSDLTGALGDGPGVTSVPSAVPVAGVDDADEVACGDVHSCARRELGQVWCWGDNGFGQLGDGTTDSSDSPVRVSDLGGATAIGAGGSHSPEEPAGGHSCVVAGEGGIGCWGRNDSGQVGDGTQTDREEKVAITLGDVVQVDGGGHHTCAVLTDGSVWCWGANDDGQVGAGAASPQTRPRRVPGVEGAVQVSAGQSHTCALLATGGVECWGFNGYGQLGDGTQENRAAPTPVVFE